MSIDDRGHDWIQRPDRTDGPGVHRRRRHELIIAGAKRMSKGRSYQFMRVLSINPRIFLHYIFWNSRMMPYGKLPRQQTEAVIIRIAWICRSKYEWTQHTAIGRSVGLTKEQVAAAGPEPESDLFDTETKALLRAVPELIDDHVLSERSQEDLSKFLSPALIVEFVALVGTYAGLAAGLNTFGAPIEDAWSS